MAPPTTRSQKSKRARESISTVDVSNDDDSDDPPLPPKKPAKRKGKAKKAAHTDPDESDDPPPPPTKTSKSKAKPKKKKRRQASPSPAREEAGASDDNDGGDDEDSGPEQIIQDKHDAAAGIPEERNAKMTADDVYTIFTLPLDAQVLIKGNPVMVTKRGRWCTICRERKKGDAVYQAFFRGGISSCRAHCKQHWETYKARCEAKDITLRKDAMPVAVLKEQERLDAEATTDGKATLDGHFEKQLGPREFSVEGALESVAKYITCCNKPLATANNVFFRNALVSMRPRSKSNDIPTTHKICTLIHNRYVQYLHETKASIALAPGRIAMTADGWSADNNKQPFLGATGSWVKIHETTRVWSIEHKVVGFKGIFGPHDGSNMAGYFFAVCRRVGIVDVEKKQSKLGPTTLDNASNNGTMCQQIEYYHVKLELTLWLSDDNQLMCFAHCINLGVLDVMGRITRTAAIETATAIWEHDPDLEGNRIMNGSLDAVAALRTLSVKIQASGQRIQHFQKLQRECGIKEPLKITMHGNTRWGTAHGMMDRGIKLGKAINLFVRTADQLFGPITVIRKNGKIIKKIAWSAFEFGEEDWARLRDGKDLLEDANNIQQLFSSAVRPTLWKVIPAMETLLTSWEKKHDDDKYEPYREALQAGIDKIQKYYAKLDQKWWYIAALFIHPYYKLEWFQIHWGGHQEQQEEIANGNPDAKNWVDEATRVVERIMAEYWQPDDLLFRQPAPRPTQQNTPRATPDDTEDASLETEYDRERRRRAETQPQGFDGWPAELRHWLQEFDASVTKETDLCQYWTTNCFRFPTIARIALDVIPAQGSSVPCERLFSGSKQTATDLRASLGHERFEELQLLKWDWMASVFDFAKANDENGDDDGDDPFAKDYDEMLKAEQAVDELDALLNG